MEGLIKKENIIFLALVYNWLANQKKELEEWDISHYIDKVNEYLKYNFNQEIVTTSSLEDEAWDYYNEIIKEMFAFKYERQPEEVIKASLQEDALSCISVAKENLEIKVEYKWISGRKGIYTLWGNHAQEKVKESLKSKGCKDIQIGYPTPAQLDGDNGYYVSYNCQEPMERVNVLARRLEKDL